MTNFKIDDIELPVNPKIAKLLVSVVVKAEVAGDLTLLLAMGKNADKLEIEGYFYEEGKTKEQLETDYYDPLYAKVRTKVVIAFDGSRYDGTWLMTKLAPQEASKWQNAFYYKMEFMKGFYEGEDPYIIL